MKEYIERAEAINAIRQFQYPYGVEFLLANIPTADVAEVRHGRWVVYGGGVFCSNCGVALKKGKIEPIGFHFCPNCGTRMDKEADHEVS